jgi:hypothetical protein
MYSPLLAIYDDWIALQSLVPHWTKELAKYFGLDDRPPFATWKATESAQEVEVLVLPDVTCVPPEGNLEQLRLQMYYPLLAAEKATVRLPQHYRAYLASQATAEAYCKRFDLPIPEIDPALVQSVAIRANQQLLKNKES